MTELPKVDILNAISSLNSDETFTPIDVAKKMLDLLPQEIWKDKTKRFLNIACKSGVFLREIRDRLFEGLKDEISDENARLQHIYEKQIFGLAISVRTALISRKSLYETADASHKLSYFDKAIKEGNKYGNIIFEEMFEGDKRLREGSFGKNKNELYAWIGREMDLTKIFEENSKMALRDTGIDVVIGNPPYQITKNGANIQIHFSFLKQVFNLKCRYISFIQPLNWLDNSDLLNLVKKNLIKLYRFSDSKVVFPTVSVPSGVGYYIMDKNIEQDSTEIFEDGKNYTTDINGNQNSDDLRILSEVKFSKSISHRISSYKGFPNENKTLKIRNKSDIMIWYKKENGKGGKNAWYYVDRRDIPDGDIIDKWKVMISNDGHAEQTVTKPQGIFNNLAQVLPPKKITTDRPHLLLAKDEKEANLIAKYANSKFFRRLLHIKAKSNSIAKNCYELVPDISEFEREYSKCKNNDIDVFLNKFYDLSDETIKDIDRRIKVKGQALEEDDE